MRLIKAKNPLSDHHQYYFVTDHLITIEDQNVLKFTTWQEGPPLNYIKLISINAPHGENQFRHFVDTKIESLLPIEEGGRTYTREEVLGMLVNRSQHYYRIGRAEQDLIKESVFLEDLKEYLDVMKAEKREWEILLKIEMVKKAEQEIPVPIIVNGCIEVVEIK